MTRWVMGDGVSGGRIAHDVLSRVTDHGDSGRDGRKDRSGAAGGSDHSRARTAYS